MEIDDIYKNYMYDLYRYLFSLSKNHHTAEDLVQETFYRTYLSLPEQNITNIKAWLFKVAYHTILSMIRSKNKKQIPNEEIRRIKRQRVQCLEHPRIKYFKMKSTNNLSKWSINCGRNTNTLSSFVIYTNLHMKKVHKLWN